MNKIKITTPENIEIEYTLADLGSRTAAAVIDLLIIFGILLVMIIIPVIIIYNTIESFGQYQGWIIGISLIISSVVYYGYFIALELTMNGRTIGKNVLKIRTLRNNGQPITLKHAAIRNIFKILVDILGVGAVLIYFNKQNKRVGDILASTIVVAEDNVDTIEVPQAITSNISRYSFLTKGETRLLEDYINRRDSLYDGGKELGIKVLEYFKAKNTPEDMTEEYGRFLKELSIRIEN